MSNNKDTGVYQLDNGYWAYRYKINIDGTLKERRRRTDELGNQFKTKKSAIKAREQAIINEKINATLPPQEKIPKKTVKEVYEEYCGLRINECYGLKWDNIDFKHNIIKIDRQMQYQEGVIKLVSLKTRNARREIVMAEPLKKYLLSLKKHRDKVAVKLAEQREQNQTFLADMGKTKISSLELVNTLDDGKIQTINSMKYHSQKIKAQLDIHFKYHYLRHTYGTVIRLYKFKRENPKTQDENESDLTHHYMISICINTGVMFNGDAHTSNNILSFTPDFVRTIYRNIYNIIPCMEIGQEYYNVNNSLWLDMNAFKARRIDFCFDLKTMYREYLKLIDSGYSLRKSTFERNYYEDNDIQTVQADDEPDIPEAETIMDNSSSNLNYIYFKSKGVNINIYIKIDELKKEQITFDSEQDYDFLRIEVQVKKNKLNAIVSKFGLKGRELQYVITPEIEHYVLNSYVKALTGTGIYVTLDTARHIINNSKYTQPKKNKLIKVIEAVSVKHGIAKLLEQIDKIQ